MSLCGGVSDMSNVVETSRRNQNMRERLHFSSPRGGASESVTKYKMDIHILLLYLHVLN